MKYILALDQGTTCFGTLGWQDVWLHDSHLREVLGEHPCGEKASESSANDHGVS